MKTSDETCFLEIPSEDQEDIDMLDPCAQLIVLEELALRLYVLQHIENDERKFVNAFIREQIASKEKH